MREFINPMIKFYIVGGIGTIINLVILYILTDFLNIWYVLSATIAVPVSVTTNFFGNRFWTFRDQLSEKGTLNVLFLQYRNFWFVTILGMIIYIVLMYILVEYFNIWYVLSAFLGIVIASFGKFLLSKFWIFKKSNQFKKL